jgi:phage terminase large subunit-like protein
LLARESIVPVGALFPKEAAESLDVFNALRVADMPGIPTIGEVCRPWVTDFVSTIFGAYDEERGKRLITEFFLLISKKNAKSLTAAGIMLTALIRNWRHSAEFLILAPTIEIANNSFIPARDMVRKDPELSVLMHIQEHYRTITNRATRATLKVVAADNESVGGKKATGVLIEELWLFGKQAHAESMLLEATGGQASRPEGFTIYLSTHSDASPAGVFEKKLKYARDVRDGERVDKNFLPVLYEFPDRMLKAGEHREKKNWYVTNPNLGASVQEDYLERKFSEAEHAGEDSLIGFMAKHLNVPIGTVLRSDGWAGAAVWDSCARPGLTLEKILARSEVVEVGIDGGGLDDLMGLSIIGRDTETREWMAWFHAWCHGVVLKKRKSEAPRLLDLQRAGDLTIVEEFGDHFDELAEIVANVYKLGLLDKIGVDAVGIGQVLDALARAKIPNERIAAISQGWKLSGAIKTAEVKLAEGKLVHCGQPMMQWCVGNAKVEPRSNAILITKAASGTAKIDPLMAGFNAVELLSRNPLSARKRFQMFTLSREQ